MFLKVIIIIVIIIVILGYCSMQWLDVGSQFPDQGLNLHCRSENTESQPKTTTVLSGNAVLLLTLYSFLKGFCQFLTHQPVGAHLYSCVEVLKRWLVSAPKHLFPRASVPAPFSTYIDSFCFLLGSVQGIRSDLSFLVTYLSGKLTSKEVQQAWALQSLQGGNMEPFWTCAILGSSWNICCRHGTCVCRVTVALGKRRLSIPFCCGGRAGSVCGC